MSTTNRSRALTLLAAGALSFAGLAACSSSGTAGSLTPGTAVTANATAGPTSAAAVGAPTAASLTADEIAGLVWMREEEQLAHDVYTTLDQRYALPVFANIARSETTHLEAVAGLLDRYGITDPSDGRPAGTFTDARLQALYDDLMRTGVVSALDALKVGARIEEIDIVDLQARAAATGHTDILAVHANLEKGSRNYLRAFTSQLSARDATYTPTALDKAAFDAILAGTVERGPGS